MATYEIFFKKSVEKDFRGIPKNELKKSSHASANSQRTRGPRVAKNSPATIDTDCVKEDTELFIQFRTINLRSLW